MTFEHFTSAALAMSLNSRTLPGADRPLRVGFDEPAVHDVSPAAGPRTRLFVTQVPLGMVCSLWVLGCALCTVTSCLAPHTHQTEADLRGFFTPFGAVEEVVLLRFPDSGA